MGNCWDQHTHGTLKTARCRMASTPVRLATQCATNGSNISSNFATDFKRLSSVQQRKRSALHLEEILARTERPRRDLHIDVQCVGDGCWDSALLVQSCISCVCCLPVGHSTLRLLVRSHGDRGSVGLGFRRSSTSSEAAGRHWQQPVVSGCFR